MAGLSRGHTPASSRSKRYCSHPWVELRRHRSRRRRTTVPRGFDGLTAFRFLNRFQYGSFGDPMVRSRIIARLLTAAARIAAPCSPFANTFFETRIHPTTGEEQHLLRAMPVMLGVLCILAHRLSLLQQVPGDQGCVLDNARRTPAHQFNDGRTTIRPMLGAIRASLCRYLGAGR